MPEYTIPFFHIKKTHLLFLTDLALALIAIMHVPRNIVRDPRFHLFRILLRLGTKQKLLTRMPGTVLRLM